jgi:flagellar M-ring protein FliF
MAETRDQFQTQVNTFMRKLTLTQKMVMGGVTLAVLAGIIGLVTLVNRPSYGTLFNNLAAQDASKIVDKLKEKSIPYTLEDGGKTILIPKNQIYDMRLALAGDGLPQSSIIGYELFDRTNLGISDFVQKVNYRRALEGELARTILEIEEVEGARVHLVVPEKALFKEDEKPATASVILKLKNGQPIKSETVKGITHLIASSIEGLDASNVTVVDSRGALLSDNSKANSVAAMTSTQYDLQRKVESYLAQKAQSLLENVVGTGNALVQVTADLDFRQVERSLEQYDPENTAIRSETISEEKNVSGDSATPSTRSNTLTNYEVNKTVEHIVENLGNIKRLSVAAVVNGVPKTIERDGQKVTEVAPRPQDEMDKLADLVRKSVGFNAQRNDEVSVTNLAFGNNGGGEQDFMYKQAPGVDWYGWGEKGFLLAAMLGGVLIIRSLLNRLRVQPDPAHLGQLGANQPMAAIRAKQEALALAEAEEEVSPELLLRAERKKRVAEYVQDKPTETSRLLKVWLAEE